MAVGSRYFTPNQFEVDQNGVPLAGAQLFFYATGTTSFQDTFQDVNLTTPNTNPVIADANGRFGSIFLSPANGYAVQLWTAPTVANPTGSEIWALDPVGPAAGGVPSNNAGIIGEVRMFAGPSISVPSGWLLCFGQAISRTVYSELFGVIGSTWGGGDGVTTFQVPDLRGRAPFGVDNMGGSAAMRVTSGVSGISGVTLGATGGDQNVQQHTHTVNDPTHTHTLTDPGHLHAYIPVSDGGTGSSAGGRAGPPASPENTQTATTGITIAAAATGITLSNYGAGLSANMPPAAMINMIIYAGV